MNPNNAQPINEELLNKYLSDKGKELINKAVYNTVIEKMVPVGTNGKIQVDIEHTLTVQIQQEMIKGFNITAYIVSRLAGKLNVNPIFLLSRLANSHYAKFTGFKGATRDEMTEDEIYSPTSIAYDWEKIVVDNERYAEEDKQLQALPEAETVEIQQNNIIQAQPTKTVLQMMMEKIDAEKKKFENITQLPIKREDKNESE